MGRVIELQAQDLSAVRMDRWTICCLSSSLAFRARARCRPGRAPAARGFRLRLCAISPPACAPRRSVPGGWRDRASMPRNSASNRAPWSRRLGLGILGRGELAGDLLPARRERGEHRSQANLRMIQEQDQEAQDRGGDLPDVDQAIHRVLSCRGSVNPRPHWAGRRAGPRKTSVHAETRCRSGNQILPERRNMVTKA